MFGDQYNYLRIFPFTAKKINHPGLLSIKLIYLLDTYIKSGDGITAERKIYKNVPYDEFEIASILKFKKSLEKYDIQFNPDAQTDDVLLRYLYAGQFNQSNAVELFKRYLMWVSYSNPFEMTEAAQVFLKEGYIYLAGRDNQFRPTIVINSYLFDTSLFNSDPFLKALNILLAICEEYMFYPGKIENIVVIIETKQSALYEFPFKQLQIIIQQLSQNFPQILDRMYIFNPSQSLILSWDFISSFIDSKTLQKIEIWNSDVFSPLGHGFEESQLEKRFGGNMGDITQFWPPTNTIQQFSRSEPEWKFAKALKVDKPFNYDVELPQKNPSYIAGQYSVQQNPDNLMSQIQKQERQQEEEDQMEKMKWEQQEKELKVQEQEKFMQLHQPMSSLFGMSTLPVRPTVDPSRVSEIRETRIIGQQQKTSQISQQRVSQTKQVNQANSAQSPQMQGQQTIKPTFQGKQTQEQKFQQQENMEDYALEDEGAFRNQSMPNPQVRETNYEPLQLPKMTGTYKKAFGYKSEKNKEDELEAGKSQVDACKLM